MFSYCIIASNIKWDQHLLIVIEVIEASAYIKVSFCDLFTRCI